MIDEAERNDTFTGSPLASLTLAQKLVELRIDHFERLSLSQPFAKNLTVFGWWGALSALVRKLRLGRLGVAARVASLDAQVRDGIAEIEKDPEYARDTHYRGHGSVSQLDETLRAFDADSPDELALLRVMLEEHKRELARERAALQADPAYAAKQPPKPPWYDRAAARVMIPVLLVALPFVAAFATWRALLTKMRPEAPVLIDAELATQPERAVSKSAHPAARAAAALHDVAALCNRATNIALGHHGTIVDLRATHIRLVARVRDASVEVASAQEALRPVLEAASAIDNGAAAIDRSWSTSVHRNTREVERCSDERDSHGNTRRRCRTETVCSSKDTTFSFSEPLMASGLRTFSDSLRGVHAELFDAPALFELTFVLRATRQQTALSRAQNDAVEAEPVTALALAHRAFRPLVATDSAPTGLEWIRLNYTNAREFPAYTTVNTSCSSTPRGPRGYNAVREWSDPIHHAGYSLVSLNDHYRAAASTLRVLESDALSLSSRSQSRRSVFGLDDEHIALSDRSNELYRLFHGDSALVFASRLGRGGYALLAWFISAVLSGALYLWLTARRRALAWKTFTRHTSPVTRPR